MAVVVKRVHEIKLDAAEMNILRWMFAATKNNKARNERVRGTMKVVEILKKIQEEMGVIWPCGGKRHVGKGVRGGGAGQEKRKTKVKVDLCHIFPFNIIRLSTNILLVVSSSEHCQNI